MTNQPFSSSSSLSPQAEGGQSSRPPMQTPSGGFLPATPGGAYPPGTGGFTPQGPGTPFPPMSGGPATTVPGGQLPLESSYIENILRLNLGKMATIYMTYENNNSWNAQVYRGVLEAAGRDHIIISDPATGMRFLLLMINLDYITFDGPLNYSYPFG